MKLISFISSIMFTLPCILNASGPAQQSMNSDVQQIVALTRENEQLKQTIKNLQTNKSGCCDTLGHKFNNVALRTDNCLYQRCSAPATCVDDSSAFKVFFKNPLKVVAAFTCLLPTEILCCPPYAICGSKSARTCLCIEPLAGDE